MSRFLDIPVDVDCLRLAAGGNRAAQRLVYDQVSGPLFALVRRMVAPRAAAEDVFQDCMIALLRSLGDYRGEAPFGAWVRQIALRQCLMHLRSPWQRARRALHSLVPGAEGSGEMAEPAWLPRVEPPSADAIDLERALSRLPDVARTVVWMFDVEGMSHEEIAAMFGRTVSFSKSQLSRAHALLRAQLTDAPAAAVQPTLQAEGQVSP